MSKVTEYLTWVHVMVKSSPERRAQWVKTVLDGIKSYRGSAKQNPSEEKEKQWLSDVLQDESKFELMGFAPNQAYIKHDGSAHELDALWIHPWGSPALVYKHRKLPILIIAGPSMRKDESILGEIPENPGESVKGLTG